MPFRRPKLKPGENVSEDNSFTSDPQQIEDSIRKITELVNSSDLRDGKLPQNLSLNNFLHIILKPDDSWDLRGIFSREQAKIVIDSLTKISNFLINNDESLDYANYQMLVKVTEARNHIKMIFIGRSF